MKREVAAAAPLKRESRAMSPCAEMAPPPALHAAPPSIAETAQDPSRMHMRTLLGRAQQHQQRRMQTEASAEPSIKQERVQADAHEYVAMAAVTPQAMTAAAYALPVQTDYAQFGPIHAMPAAPQTIMHTCTCMHHHGCNALGAPPLTAATMPMHAPLNAMPPPALIIPPTPSEPSYPDDNKANIMEAVASRLDQHRRTNAISPNGSDDSRSDATANTATSGKRIAIIPKRISPAERSSRKDTAALLTCTELKTPRPNSTERGRPTSKPNRITPTAKRQRSLTPRGSSNSIDDIDELTRYSDYQHTLHMLIPSDAIGCIIGRGGSGIREINAISDCTLSVRDASSFPLEDDNSRVLRMYGTPKGICIAQRLVIDRIRADRVSKGDLCFSKLTMEEPLVAVPPESVTKAMAAAIETDDDLEDDVMEDTTSLKWLVHKDHIGRIMGKDGMILKAIARDTNTSIHVSSTKELAPGATERMVTITGSEDAIDAARATIQEKAGGRPLNPGSTGKCGQYFVIPFHAAGALIGIQGAKIRRIADESGARLQLPAEQDLPLASANRLLHIQGSTAQVTRARAIALRRLNDFCRSSEAAVSLGASDPICIKLLLPTRLCSSLLDQRGALIREITEKAGVHSRFLSPLENDLRVCMFVGDIGGVFRAEKLVLQKLAADESAIGGVASRGVPPRKRRRNEEAGEYSSESHPSGRGNYGAAQRSDDRGGKRLHRSPPLPRASYDESRRDNDAAPRREDRGRKRLHRGPPPPRSSYDDSGRVVRFL